MIDMSTFLSKPNSSTCVMDPIPSHLLKDFTPLHLMPVFLVLFMELFKLLSWLTVPSSSPPSLS